MSPRVLPLTDSAGMQRDGRVTEPATPSVLYGARWWKLALAAARNLPPWMTTVVGLTVSRVYWALARQRREVLVQNLLPAVNGDRASAERIAVALGGQFVHKLADLWRFESGRPVDALFGELTGWEHFKAAQESGRGVLLVTPHLGNWEFGGPLLTQRGYKLQVITRAEPGRGLTEMRRDSRARWGIETLVVGDNPFAFVDIIKRLTAGATVALLMDRPPAASAVTVELFGRPFCASIAAAELARASGCVLLPVYLPRTKRGYEAHILPAIEYDRRALGTRETRQTLTQEIIRVFEPAIRQHLDQWYHFVPIWPRS